MSAATLAFGNLRMDAAETKIVTLSSTGTEAVTLSSGTVSGAAFSISGVDFPVTIQPGKVKTLVVDFEPKAMGPASGRVTIDSNSVSGSSSVVTLTGAGTAALHAVTCQSSSETGAGSDTCTVSLSGAAGSGGISVSMSSNNASVKVPATVVVPAGSVSQQFAATISSVTSAQQAVLTAQASNVSKSFDLQLNGGGGPLLSLSASSLSFGNVPLNTRSTLPLTLSSTGASSVTISSAAVSGTGFSISGATFPVTLKPGIAVTMDVTFDPKSASTDSGKLTLASNSSSSSTSTVGLSGTGENAAHQVDLSWSAPSSSPIAIAGYSIYRAPSGSSSYTLLNSSLDTATTYVDSTVQAGAAYDYVVKSVDSSGVESTASNEVAVSIP